MERFAKRPQFDAGRADVRQFLAREKHLRLAGQIQGKKVGERHGNTIQHLLERTDRGAHAILLDERDQPIGDPGALGEFALRQSVHLAHGLQMATDISTHDVYYIKQIGTS